MRIPCYTERALTFIEFNLWTYRRAHTHTHTHTGITCLVLTLVHPHSNFVTSSTIRRTHTLARARTNNFKKFQYTQHGIVEMITLQLSIIYSIYGSRDPGLLKTRINGKFVQHLCKERERGSDG